MGLELGFGFTAVPADQMEDLRLGRRSTRCAPTTPRSAGAATASASRGHPNNSLGLSGADFNAQTAAIVARLAAAIQASADPAAPGAGACQPPWCTAASTGAAFTPAWSTFSTWTPTGPAFGSLPETVAAGVATGPMSVEPQIGGIVVPLPVDTTAGLSSSSPGGSFSTSPTGPWTPTLDVTIPAGSTSATFYMLDSQAGTPTVTATIGDQSAAQPQVVTAPAAPLALTNGGNVTAFAAGGAPVAVDPALALSDTASPTVVSASVAIATGYTPGDVLTATTAGTSISAAYANGTLTLSGIDSLANYQAVLQSVAFSGTATTGGTRTVLWTVDDGSTAASAVSTIAYTAAPSAPTGAAASAGDGQAVVSFAPPASDGGSSITSYTVTSSPGGITATGGASPIAVTGLANGTSYTFTVTATNAVGTGPASAASNSVTPGAPVSAGGGGGGSGGTGPAVVPVTPATPIAPAAPLPAAGAAAAPAGAGQAKAAAVVLTVAALRPVILRGSRPAVSLTVRISKPTTLVVSLRDGRGRLLAYLAPAPEGGHCATSRSSCRRRHGTPAGTGSACRGPAAGRRGCWRSPFGVRLAENAASAGGRPDR